MDHIYRDNIDRMRGELAVRDKLIVVLKEQNALLEKKMAFRRIALKQIARATIVLAAVAGFVLTGSGWLIALALLAASQDGGGENKS